MKPPSDEHQEVVTTPITPDPGPAPPEDIREVFEWHEQRLSKRGLEPEGLKRGVTIQHKFDNGEVLTASKAEEGLTKVQNLCSIFIINSKIGTRIRHPRLDKESSGTVQTRRMDHERVPRRGGPVRLFGRVGRWCPEQGEADQGRESTF